MSFVLTCMWFNNKNNKVPSCDQVKSNNNKEQIRLRWGYSNTPWICYHQSCVLKGLCLSLTFSIQRPVGMGRILSWLVTCLKTREIWLRLSHKRLWGWITSCGRKNKNLWRHWNIKQSKNQLKPFCSCWKKMVSGCIPSRYQRGTSGGRSDWSQKTSVWHLGKHSERSQQDGQHWSAGKDTGTVLQSSFFLFI